MKVLHAITGFILLFELPIPIYWLVLHPLNSFWRNRVRAAFWTAGLSAWLLGGAVLWRFHERLLRGQWPGWFALAAGFLLIGAEVYLFIRVERELGSRRLIGLAELTCSGELFSRGLYARVRHPRYTGMFCAVIGAALLSGTPYLWAVLAVWFFFARAVIVLEERELVARFGPAYRDYQRRVPAFLPFGT